jgi:hypothetical protein
LARGEQAKADHYEQHLTNLKRAVELMEEAIAICSTEETPD